MADPLSLPEQGKEIDFQAKKDLLKKAHDEMKQLKNVVQTSNSSVSATRDVSEDGEALEEEPTEQGEVDIRNTNTELRAKIKMLEDGKIDDPETTKPDFPTTGVPIEDISSVHWKTKVADYYADNQ